MFRSPLGEATADAHLKWFHGTLNFDRKRLRRLQDQGLNLVLRVTVRGGACRLSPDAVLAVHLFRIPLEVRDVGVDDHGH